MSSFDYKSVDHELFRQLASQGLPEEDWVCTLSGKKFFPLSSGPEDITIDDIAQGISRRFRFGGQSTIDYTVAQHSVEVSMMFTDVNLALWGLLHDAAEGYLVDWQRPVKRAQAWYCWKTNRFLPFGLIEDRILAAVAEKFELESTEIPIEVESADFIQMLRERKWLFGERQPVWNGLPPEWDAMPEVLAPIRRPTWTKQLAKRIFLDRFHSLIEQRAIQHSAQKITEND